MMLYFNDLLPNIAASRAGDGILIRYLFYSVAVIAFVYFVIWGQTRSLYKANRLLREREEALKQIALQREELEYKNRNITDSIVYAKKIQEALIPSQSFFEKHFRESFILFMPRDIVSGDFYYIRESNGKTWVVLADCTGHGVPGALMSMIGLQTIDRVIQNEEHSEPSEILDLLNTEVDSIIHREEDYSHGIKDGMDIAVCCIDREKYELSFSGAFLPLYMIRGGKLTETKGDKQFIGSRMTDSSYTNHKIPMEEGDSYYLLSDGYSDQFGGAENKKFMNRRIRYFLVTIHEYPLKDQGDILEDNFNTWKGPNEQIDDVLMIGFRP
ncbi:MAG: SpoIIE family protein phosphatase [Bacteroidales bacterium]